MTRSPYAVPLRADFGAARRPSQALIRLAVASLIAHVSQSSSLHQRANVEDIFDVLARTYANDDVAPLLLRAASVPAITTQAGWADSLANASVADFIGTIGPASAGAALFSRGLQLSFQTSANIVVPGLSTSASNTAFVQQGAPIPVHQLSFSSSALLQPRKLATIVPFNREIVEHSIPSIEAMVRAALSESVGLALDVAMFGATAGSDIVVAGLRNGIAAGTESANADLHEAMLEDIGTVVDGVATVAGNSPIAVIVSPARARRMKLRLLSAADPGFEVFASNGVGANELVAVASNGIVSACDPVPRFDASDQGTIVMDDTAPAQLVDAGGVAAGGTRSLWQADSIALRMIYECSWARRSDSAVAWVEDVIW
jgi:hypothetical protein